MYVEQCEDESVQIVHTKYNSDSSSVQIAGPSGLSVIHSPFLHSVSSTSDLERAAATILQRQLSSSFYLFLHGASVFLYYEFLEVCQHMLEACAISL